MLNIFSAKAEQNDKMDTNSQSIVNTDIENTGAESKVEQGSDVVIPTKTDKKGLNKNVQFITVLDIVQDEQITPELKGRITETLNRTQYEFDKYNTYIDKHGRNTDNKFIEVERNINNLKTFTEELEANFSLAKWMVISLSIGIICLATIITMMWKGVVNVNRNDVEVLFSIERAKKELRSLEKRVEMLEAAYKGNEKR